MKRRHLLSLPLALPALAMPPALTAAQAAQAAQPGQPVAWPSVSLLDGRRLTATDWQGRAGVVVFWTVSCPFCRRHNPHIERLHRAARAAGLPLNVLGVARENDAAAVRRHAHQQGYSFPITLDHAAMGAALSERRVVPLTATVDRQGRLKQVLPGEMFEEDVMALLALAR